MRKYIAPLAKSRFTGFVLVTVLSLFVLSLFYGKVILSLNSTFFSTEGDGIQSYFNTYYQAKYESSLMYSHSMNYPYGEVAFYTLSQPLLAGSIKFISRNFVDISGYTVGILNFLMLFSVLLAAIFLYLIFIETGLPALLAIFPSVGIAFLSPQIDRFGGHFTLAYVCAIPLLLYLMLLFHKHMKIIYSILTGIVLFVLMTGHLYFAGFFSVIIIFYWWFKVSDLRKGGFKPYLNMALNFALQLAIPLIIYFLITGYYAHLSPDRPSKPFGFLLYKASPESVFLPLWVDYGKVLYKMRDFSYVQWEGISYVGLTAVIGFFIMLATIIHRMIRRNWHAAFRVTDHDFLNITFWASFAALLYSFGVPFVFGLDFLVDYIGPLQQMRALGRFAWLFYFTVNIVVFYRLWQWQQKGDKKLLRSFILLLGIIMLFTDVFFYLKTRQNSLVNHFSSWIDVKNTEPDNQWVKQIDPHQYQAIIPLPFYHMGSDNYNMDVRCKMLTNSLFVSMKTGLPVTAIYLSRASVKQSIKDIAIVMEPYRELEIIHDFPNHKPFLVVAVKCNEYTAEEMKLLHKGTKIDSNAFLDLYRLPFDSLSLMPKRKSEEIHKEFADNKLYDLKPVLKSDTAANIIYMSFNDSGLSRGYRGNALQITGRLISTLFYDSIPSANTLNYMFSFWFSPINEDLFPKTRLEIDLYDSKGKQYDYKNLMLSKFLKTVDGQWGLIEYSFQFASPGDRLKITLCNTLIKRSRSYYIDEFMIKPENCNVYGADDKFLSKNNRYYPK